jgi:uncharacterized protein (DUF433 family)
MIMLDRERIFTASEAAVAAGVPLKIVHREIDQGPLKAARGRDGNKRCLREQDLIYLAAANGLDNRLVQLTREGRSKLYDAIALHRRRGRIDEREISLFGGGLSLDLKGVLKQVRTKLAMLERARKQVIEDTEVRGGEPCIAGTRIGVYEIAAMLEQGESEAELLAGYPSLRPEQLQLARIYARAYPRRGRPRRHPWHSAEAHML